VYGARRAVVSELCVHYFVRRNLRRTGCDLQSDRKCPRQPDVSCLTFLRAERRQEIVHGDRGRHVRQSVHARSPRRWTHLESINYVAVPIATYPGRSHRAGRVARCCASSASSTCLCCSSQATTRSLAVGARRVSVPPLFLEGAHLNFSVSALSQAGDTAADQVPAGIGKLGAGGVRETTLGELLPDSFGPEDLPHV